MSAKLPNIIHEDNEICNSQPISLPSSERSTPERNTQITKRPPKYTGQRGHFRSVEEIDAKYRHVFTYPYFNLVQSSVIDDALYSDKSMVVCAPTGSGKTVIFEMAILQLLLELEDKNNTDDFKIIYMAPVKALCTERITEWYSKFTKLGLLCIEVTGDTDVDFPQLKPYRIIITTPEKWDMLTRRWMEHNLVKVVKLLLIDEVHILNDVTRGPVLEAVVTRMKTIESSVRSGVRLVAVSATVSNPQDVAAWLGAGSAPAVHYKFGDECRPVRLTRIVEGYPCSSGTSIFKFDIILNYKLWPIIQRYHNGKPTLIFCNTRKSVMLTAETLSREITVGFSPEQRGKLTALASTIKNKKIQSLVLSGVGCHHAGLLFEERVNIEQAFRNRDLPILITTTTLAMGVNLPAHLVIIKNTQQYINGAYQEYSISTVLQMVGRAGRPQFDQQATAVIMTRMQDKARYQSLVGGSEPLQSFLHKRLAENINSEIALGTIGDVSQCVQWLNSTFLRVRAAKDPKRYLGLPSSAPAHLITKKIEELCVRALNGLESSGLVTMDELSCIESTEAGRLMSLHYLDLETMKLIMKIEGTETLERLLWLVCESHELSDMHLRVDERRCLNALNRNNSAPTIRYQMKGKISSRQMKLNCVIQSVLGCLPIPDPSLNQEALKIMRTADRVCKCLVSYVTRPNLISQNPKFYAAIINSLTLAKCITAHLWENSLFVSRQLKGIGPTFSSLLASAGKTNFMLLYESHPRDLERIMNKGPPAGNILRKQISLLPKYNITITLINEKSIRVQLSLLNQSYLAENIESLTAGARHKSYIVVGDSENLLLYFSSFKDSDLINIYDGSINFEVSRRHLHEHKVIAHCISSSFVGIDDQCEYLFKDINPFPLCIEKTSNNKTAQKISPNRQTYITDVFKERKRRNNDNTQFKEKKKKENLLIDKFKTLNESFERTSKDIKDISNESEAKTIAENLVETKSKINIPLIRPEHNLHYSSFNLLNYEVDKSDFLDDYECEDIDNEEINNLLNEIEGEVNNPSTSTVNSIAFNVSKQNDCNKKNSNTFNRDKSQLNLKNNYTFLDRLENKNSECENDNSTSNKECVFSDTIKSHIQQYLKKAQNNIKCTVTDSTEFIEKTIDLENSTTKSKNVELLHYDDMITQKDSSNIIEDNKNMRTKTDISRENVETKTSPKTMKMPLETPDLTQIKNKRHSNENISDKIMSNVVDKHPNNEYSVMPYVPVVISTKQNNTQKLQTLKTPTNTYNAKVDTSSDSSENLNPSTFFSAECALIPCEPECINPLSKNDAKQTKTLGKSFDDHNVKEKHDLNKNNIFSAIHSAQNNIDIDIKNLNSQTNSKDIKKYSFNAIKTIGVHEKNISKICTLKVALDVTEIVHNKDNFDSQNDRSNYNFQNINEHEYTFNRLLSNVDNNAVLQKEYNIKNMKDLNIYNNDSILLNQHNEPLSEKRDKPSIRTQFDNKETTVEDILNRYQVNAIRQNDLNVEDKGPENCTSRIKRNIKDPKNTIKRKYRISDLDTIDITLPESLVPSQSQVINKTPINFKNNEKNQYRCKKESIAEEKLKINIMANSEDEEPNSISNITCISEQDGDVENTCEEDPGMDLSSYLDEPVNLSNFELNPAVLDPKTLLQSLNNEEIIPPPPAFCDNNAYSPIPSVDLNTSDVFDLSCNDLRYSNAPLDNNMFATTFDHDLRSSTETDTWNLSRNDDYLMCNPTPSYDAVTNGKTVGYNRIDFLKSRLSKLSQFKFKRKNMLRK